MISNKLFKCCLPLIGSSMLLFGGVAASGEVVATAQTIEVIGDDMSVDVQFSVEVTNSESSVASDVWVIFADGQQMYVGDVAAEGSAVSGPGTQNIDLSVLPTKNQPVPVTLQYTQEGVDVEQAQTLVVRLVVDGQ